MSGFRGRVLNSANARGPVLVLDEPLSFWGGFDPASGRIVDRRHPQEGWIIAGKILVLPATRGSGGTPGGIAEALRRGTAPAGFVVGKPEINLAVGCLIAGELYNRHCPVVEANAENYRFAAAARFLTIEADGRVF